MCKEFLSEEFVRELGGSLGYSVQRVAPCFGQATSLNAFTKITELDTAAEKASSSVKKLFIGYLTPTQVEGAGATLYLRNIQDGTDITFTLDTGTSALMSRLLVFNYILMIAGTRNYQFVGWQLDIA